MKRRNFLEIGSLSLAGLLLDKCDSREEFDVDFLNDMAVGHLAFESRDFPKSNSISTKYLIVGGGISGLSAAYQIRKEDFILAELSDMLGGSSASSEYNGTPICHGAHYDLAYPENYGEKVLSFMSELGLIKFDSFSRTWRFVDKKYLITKNRESQTYAFGNMRKDLIAEGPAKGEFVDLMKGYAHSMIMPTKLIDKNNHHLNEVSFLSWLEDKISLTPDFIESLDYHMKDDYGADCNSVSALAGIHYFACRPYYTQPVELFSPPEGNAYFVNKIARQLPGGAILTSHLVKRIKESNTGFQVEIVNAKKREIVTVNCEKIIFAGHKHSLKYVYPADYNLFQNVDYAPWVVVSIVLNRALDSDVFWQNEMLTEDKSLMGFTNSKSQYSVSGDRQVLTVYFCFKPEEREMMSLIRQKKHVFINQTISHLENYFDRPLRQAIQKIFIKQMGHAMPIPKPGYLFNDANKIRSNPNLVYAGVDNGRLPLLFEAIDSGISAVEELSKAQL